MQVESNNNYNTLGRMGPIYPRPEYRPKSAPQESPGQDPGGGRDKVDVSQGHGGKAKAQKAHQAAALAEGRLSVNSAKALTASTAEAISRLPPQGVRQAPHAVQGLGLLAPRYV
jgi:hypothetical protein